MISLRAILPSEVQQQMGRRRGQRCPVHKTTTGWKFSYRVDSIDGRRIERTKHLEVKGRREAEKLRDEFLTTINRPEVLIPAQTRFGVILEKFIDSLGLRDSSIATYSAVVRKHIRPRWGDVRICDIEQMDVESWLVQVSKGMGRERYNKLKSVFRQAWLAAVRWGFTKQADPIGLMPRTLGRPLPGREQKLPTENEMHVMLAALPEPERLMAQIMMLTGIRAGEALALRWMDVESDTLKVSRNANQNTGKISDVKTPKSRRSIPIGHLRAMLQRPAEVRRDALIYTRDGSQSAYWHLQDAFKAAAKIAGCDYRGFGAHVFRRWHNTEFRKEGGSVELAMGQMGHGSREVNDRYMLDSQIEARAQVAVKLAQKVRVM